MSKSQHKPSNKVSALNTERPNGKAWSRKKWPNGAPPEDVVKQAVKHSKNAHLSAPKKPIHRKFTIDAWSDR